VQYALLPRQKTYDQLARQTSLTKKFSVSSLIQKFITFVFEKINSKMIKQLQKPKLDLEPKTFDRLM